MMAVRGCVVHEILGKPIAITKRAPNVTAAHAQEKRRKEKQGALIPEPKLSGDEAK